MEFQVLNLHPEPIGSDCRSQPSPGDLPFLKTDRFCSRQQCVREEPQSEGLQKVDDDWKCRAAGLSHKALGDSVPAKKMVDLPERGPKDPRPAGLPKYHGPSLLRFG